MEKYRVFVYGTLMRNGHNHGYLRSSKFLGDYHTGPGFTKITKSLPYLVKDASGPGCSGELYEVSSGILAILDDLECHPDWYKRQPIKIFSLDEMESTMALCYLMPKERLGKG